MEKQLIEETREFEVYEAYREFEDEFNLPFDDEDEIEFC